MIMCTMCTACGMKNLIEYIKYHILYGYKNVYLD